ncbi:MAG: tyrosine-type recombinase/integrase [Methylocystis sp.]
MATKITKRLVDAVEPAGKESWIADSEMPGFFLRVSRTGIRTFAVQYRHGRGRAAPKRVYTIGRYPVLTVDQARTEARRILAEVRLGGDPAGDRSKDRKALTLQELADDWLANVKDTRKDRTEKEYRRLFEKNVYSHLGNRRPSDIAVADVARVAKALSEKGVVPNRTLAALSTFFGWAERHGFAPENHNPASAKRAARRKEHGRERFLTTEELARLGATLAEAETLGLPWHVDEGGPRANHLAKAGNRRTLIEPGAILAIRLLALTGARLREILTLRWQDVDIENSRLFLQDSKTGRRTVLLPPAARELLAGVSRDGGFVVPGERPDQPRADLNRPWRRIRKAAALDDVRIHDLRHSFASVGASSGLGLPLIGALLGHRVSQTTARYAHLHNDPLRQAVDRIGNEIANKLEGRVDAIVPLRGVR